MNDQDKSSSPTILLVDNGSTRVDAAVQLRLIAQKLSYKTGQKVHTVSMQHSDQIPAKDIEEKLAGKPAQVFKDFMTKQLEENQRDFILIPLFFGKSRAITSFVPTQMEILEEQFGPIVLNITDVLYPLPKGNPRLVEILYQHAIIATNGDTEESLKNVVLVDHGSPLPAVNEVRQHIANALNTKLPANVELEQAAMERRKGKKYDFNGELLEDYLENLALAGEKQATVLLLFLLPGTHAGENGDIVQICNTVMKKHPGFAVSISPLIGENELLIECLSDRLQKQLPS